MSFVLEALKKQQANSAPETAVPVVWADTRNRRPRLWSSLFAAAMAANVGVLVWVFAVPPGETPEPGTAAAQAAVQAGASAPRTQAVAVEEPQGTPPSPPPPELAPSPIRLGLRDLPDAARARFPGIAFSTHVYAVDADLRAIVANGQRLREGDRVRGLEIREITETGVLLAFERYLVEVPIFTDWNDG